MGGSRAAPTVWVLGIGADVTPDAIQVGFVADDVIPIVALPDADSRSVSQAIYPLRRHSLERANEAAQVLPA